MWCPEMQRPDYCFKTVTRADFPLLRGWLAMPHVMAVWGDPDEELALIEREVDGGECRMHVVHWGVPIGYIQDWDARSENHFHDLPESSRAVDTFLGESRLLGRGHAKAYVRKYASDLIAAGAPLVATDPRLSNPRGIAMYLAAGFQKSAIRPCETGEDVWILTYPDLPGMRNRA